MFTASDLLQSSEVKPFSLTFFIFPFQVQKPFTALPARSQEGAGRDWGKSDDEKLKSNLFHLTWVGKVASSASSLWSETGR